MALGTQPRVRAGSQTPLTILAQERDHAQSMEVLAKNGLRPLTQREALSRAPELIEKLMGKWFYLDGKGVSANGIYTFNAHGELARPTGKEKYDQKIRLWSGDMSLSLFVYPGGYYDWRFGLLGDLRKDNIAPVVVGVKINSEAREAMRR